MILIEMASQLATILGEKFVDAQGKLCVQSVK